MINTWNQLKEREKVFVIAGAVILGFYLLFSLILNPLANQVDKKERELKDKAELVIWMRDALKLYENNKQTQKISLAKLSSVISIELQRPPFNAFPYQIQQAQNNLMTLTFNEVPFREFMHWLKTLTEHYQVKIENLVAQKVQDEGLVRINLSLKVD
jgi:general secretion pathway protein M